MHSFRYKGSELYCENVSLAALAKKHGTPLYVYSLSTIQDHYRKLDQALSPLDHQICYAMKANSNLAILRQIAQMGGGFDTVSAGEIFRVEKAGGDIRKCVFAGVGKTEEEIEYALRRKIGCFNVESLPELDRIDRVARKLRVKARIAVRVNPNVEAGGHKKITTGTYENKFGIAFEQVPAVYAHAAKLRNIEIYGLQMHIGSRIGEVAPFVAAVKKVIPLVKTLKAKHKTFTTFDIGGGIEIVYDHALASSDPAWWKSKTARKFLTPQEYAGHLVPLLKPLGLKIVIEPGRFIAGNAGVLLTEVQFVKKTGIKNFVIVDAAMNDLIRPALYESFHEIIPVKKTKAKPVVADVVGPVCESGDCFAHDRKLPAVKEGDLLSIMSAGAYGFVMGGNYNSRPLPAEILVEGAKARVVRKRQNFDDLIAGEILS
ncbi:diaminopimelate decarboxylase [Oscillatoria amoena NRMC-F 0135]|nr:diaminopimelate decarboxylase [Oscillatoria amoena NRMC-F 0135]